MKHTHKTYLILCSLFLGATLITACNSQPAKPKGPVREIVITADDKMKFDLETIQAKPGEEIKIILKNIGTMPKESMGHNWVLLDKNTKMAEFAEAGFGQASTDYISPEMDKKVLARTPIIGPGETAEVTFTAPSIASPYDFLCTFPGHFAAGMKGVLVVQ